MAVLTLHVNPDHPEPRKIAHAAEVLARGGVAMYPTDTVYALGCALSARKTAPRLYQMKRMDAKQRLSLLCADLRDLSRYAIVSDFAYRTMRRILPGPYTVVLPATPMAPRMLLSKQRTIGIRVPRSPIDEALVRALGEPLLTTSAIPPGADRACHDVEEGKEAWPHALDVAIDGGLTPGEPSTVVSLVGDEIEILREGLGPVEGVLT